MSLIRNLMQKSFNVFGYDNRYDTIPKDMDEEFKEVYRECRDYSLTSIERMYALFKAVEYVVNSKIPGDFVECGVWKGGSSMAIAHTLQRMKKIDRKIYLYDTFKGTVKPTEKDIQLSDSSPAIDTWKKKQKDDHNEWYYSPIDEVRKNMFSTGFPQNNIIFIEGKVEDTIPGIVPSQIALLRLDTDWYESTYHELNHLFPLLSNNGILIIDDYGHFEGAKLAADKYFNENNINILLNRIDYTGRLGIKLEKS